MNFTDLDIKSCYESGVDDIIAKFYDVVLGTSIRYDRIAGFFSSSSLAVASRGLAKFIQNGGKMRLIASPNLNAADSDIIRRVVENPASLTAEELGLNLNDIETEFVENHVKGFGWMLANNILEVKLAIVVDEIGRVASGHEIEAKGLFHQKVGILTDVEGHRLSFSGSINESASAWVNNDEEFKVFKEWSGAKEYFDTDNARFENLWAGKRSNVRVFDLPTAVKERLIQYSKDFDIESISIEKYKQRKCATPRFETRISLFPYQSEALIKWKANNYQMLFEMATGTGKTRTAIAGVEHLMINCPKLVVIVACPQNTLSVQWKGEVEKLGISVDSSEVIDGTNPRWKSKLGQVLLQIGAGFANRAIIYTTHATASSKKFIDTVHDAAKGFPIVFVGDEVHWLGASKLRSALLPCYKYRIGLSATPSRWFDDYGTRLLEEYFANAHYEFSLRDALREINPLTGKHFLVNYYYHIKHVQLNEEELHDYAEITQRIINLYKQKEKDIEAAEKYERLIERRADIIKNAAGKLTALNDILDEIEQERPIENTIIFVSPQQIIAVQQILSDRHIVFHKLTQDEGTKKEARFGNISEREHIIRKFKEKEYKILIAIKCLDEGIDIPTANCGILMASSTNPREYVQRIGRIIRQSEDKDFAFLYDICVETSEEAGENSNIEKSIRAKETLRMREIAENAINSYDALANILTIN